MLRKIFNIYEDNEFKIITIFGININIKNIQKKYKNCLVSYQ